MLTEYRHILAQADWQPVADERLPAAQTSWLGHTGSLTEKLLQVTDRLTVEVIQARWLAKNSADSTACPEAVWLREVLLQDGAEPWIFAQTLVPQRTIEQVAPEFPTFGDKPIGLWLFPQHPKRMSLTWWQDPATGLYARKACYTLKGYPLEIRELFLSGFDYPPVMEGRH